MSRESRQKRTDKKVASKEHRRDKLENTNKKHTDSRNKLEATTSKRREGSSISGGIQPRHEDKGKGNGCNTAK